MELYQTFHACLLMSAAVVFVGIGVGVWCRERKVIPGRRALHHFRQLPWYVKIVLIILIVQCIVHGSTKTNQTDDVGNGTANGPLFGLMFVRPSADIPQSPVSDEDIERGFQLVSVSTNDDLCYVMPEGAEYASNWHLRGAYEDVSRLDFHDWRFPLGSNSFNQLWAFTWGKIRTEIRDTVHEISAVGVPMSAVPSVSRLWTAETPEGSRLIAWESFIVGRLPISDGITNASVINAQIELYSNGDFVARSNNVESLYRRIDPNDWDGDGWHNDDDDNLIIAAEPFIGFSQSLPPGANPSAYCWIDIVTPYNSHVEFVGDGLSDLDDPVLITGAGVTNRIRLLIGKAYTVSSDQPITVTDRSSPDIEITGDGTCALSIVYPIEFSACEGNGGSFVMFTSPSGLNGTYEWTNSCCAITGFGNQFWYAHNWSCLCSGCQARGVFRYEGYSLSCDGGWCCCPCYYDHDEYHYETQVDDGPYSASASVSFSVPAVIFEDTYTNRPGEVVERRSTITILRCTAHGGSEGTVASFWLSNASKIIRTSGGDLPLTQFVPPGQKLEFEVEYEGCQPSQSVNDIAAYASISGSSQESSSELTSIKVQLTAVYAAPENPNTSRHVYGVGEKVSIMLLPALQEVTLNVDKVDFRDNVTPYDTFSGEVNANASTSRVYWCPAAGTIPAIQISYNEVVYCPVMSVFEPQSVFASEAIVTDSLMPGLVGMGVMKLSCHVGPLDVSFRGVKIYEIPCTNSIPPIGYFSSTNYIGQMTHVEGAGWTHPVLENNFWTHDDVGYFGNYRNWSSGRLEWMIPVGWKRYRYDGDDFVSTSSPDYYEDGDASTRTLMIGGREDLYKEVFCIDANGAAAVEKFGYRLERGRWSFAGTILQLR